MNPSQSINKTSNFLLQNVNNDNPIKLLLLTIYSFAAKQTVPLSTIPDPNKPYGLYMTSTHQSTSRNLMEFISSKQTKMITNNGA